MSKRHQPPWSPPAKSDRPVLKLYNSLSRKKEVFIPNCGNFVNWYSCGPTVYDASHMGHARSYISFDILRRIMSDYFGYNVHYVMNITDIDDKIIRRARQNHLYEKYVTEGWSLEVILDDASAVMSYYEDVVNNTADPDKKTTLQNMLNNVATSLAALKEAVVTKDQNLISKAMEDLLKTAKDPISDWLDRKYGDTVTDNNIFTSLPRYWENEFHKDMRSLNVLPPDVLTRVSEYIPQIIKFIEKIIDNKLAYESNGSVYFSVGEFDARENHHYARLVPEAFGDTRSLQEGEGDLSDETAGKRSPNDFALWKRSKSGEPRWESPWGAGRPGWHIECSAMAADVCGPKLDVHTGGVDLKFPHHDNELAQSEAYFDCPGWVNYFLHTGHLTIAGCKMSKSLKNFVTIGDALRRHSARQLRLAFLLHAWNSTLDYSPNTMEVAVQTEKMFSEFFLTVKDAMRSGSQEGDSCWGPEERALHAKLTAAKDQVHAALCDNMDTRGAIDALRELVAGAHQYLRRLAAPPSAPLLARIARYVTDMLRVFGAIDGGGAIGFPAADVTANANVEETVMPYLEALGVFRARVRDISRRLGPPAGDLLQLCDDLRDRDLPALGVRLEDKPDRTVFKLVSAEQLQKEKEEKKRIEMEKEKKRQEQLEAQRAKEELKKIPPAEMFRRETDKYSQFDDKGLPTHDQKGQELSKGLIKKLQKLQLAQEKKYNEYLTSLNSKC